MSSVKYKSYSIQNKWFTELIKRIRINLELWLEIPNAISLEYSISLMNKYSLIPNTLLGANRIHR